MIEFEMSLLVLKLLIERSAYQVNYFARCNKIVQAIHNLLDRGIKVPPVQIQDIDVARTQFL